MKYKQKMKNAAVLSAMLLATCAAHAQESGTKADTSSQGKAAAKTVTVTGVIRDAVSGKGLPGIRITIEGFSAAITDNDGKFNIKAPSFETQLLVAGDGYQERMVSLRGKPSVEVTLYDGNFRNARKTAYLPMAATTLDKTTASVAVYETEGSWKRPFETGDNLLQGNISGLNAIRRSGAPGAGSSLFLRGFNSLYGTNKPLIVVDNMLFDAEDYGESIIANNYTNPLALIDARDIENITVLRDASSIYGTKGANGAILIRTIRAKEQATKIDFGVYSGINFAPKALPVMNAADYRIYLSEMLQSKGMTNTEIAALPYMNDDRNNPDYFRYHHNTDWQNKVMDNSVNQSYYLRVTGGDNIATYALSMGFLKNEAAVKSTDLTRYNTRFNADLNFSQKLKGFASLSFAYNEQNLKDQGIAPLTNPLYLAQTKAPFLPAFEVNDQGIESPNLADADTLGKSNPSTIISGMQAYNKFYRFSGSFGFKYDFAPKFAVSTMVGVVYDKVRENFFVPRKGVANDTLFNAVADSRLGTQVKRLFSLYNDTRLSYDNNFGAWHKLSANLGLRYQKNTAEQDFGLGFNSGTDELVSVQSGVAGLRQVGGGIGEWNWLNTYFNMDYGFREKLFLSLNVAMDASSRFGKDMRKGIHINNNVFALMPSLGAAWLVSSEPFMQDTPFDLLKLRLTGSVAGNDDIGNYSARSTFVSQNLLGMQGLVRSGIANTSLQWETTSRLNFGIDAAVLDERLNFSADAYWSKTYNMLAYEVLPTVAGFQQKLTNRGAMSNMGIDLSLNGRIINTTNFTWDAGVNISTYRNKVFRIPGDSLTTQFAGATMLTKEGEAANLFYGYQTNGVYASDAEAATEGLNRLMHNGAYTVAKGGDVRFVDRNNDGMIDEKDRTVIGNPNPSWIGGITSSMRWKRFTLDALFSFTAGNDVYNQVRHSLEAVSGTENQLESVRNRWRAEGQVTNMPKASFGDPMGNARFSDRFIEDGAYFRLRTLSIAYDIPMKGNGIIKNAGVYVTGNNLFTFTRYLGYDPEFSAGSSIFAQGIDTGLQPLFRSALMGLRIGL